MKWASMITWRSAYHEWNLWHNWFIKPEANEWHVRPIAAAFAAHLNMLCQEAGNLNISMAAMFQPINEGAIVVRPFSAELTAMGQVFVVINMYWLFRVALTFAAFYLLSSDGTAGKLPPNETVSFQEQNFECC